MGFWEYLVFLTLANGEGNGGSEVSGMGIGGHVES